MRAIQRDRSKQHLRPPGEDVEQMLEQIVSPITYSQNVSAETIQKYISDQKGM